MSLRVVRRHIVLMAVLLLGLGLVARDAVAADIAADMGAKMSVVSVDTASSNGCEACGGDDGTSAEDCHAACSNTAVLLSRFEPVRPVASMQWLPRIMPAPPGQASGPEPPPPEPVALS